MVDCNYKDICNNGDACYDCNEMDKFEPGPSFTCYACQGKRDCDYAWDLMNLNGKCRFVEENK